MGKGDDSASFAEAVNAASQIPDDKGMGAVVDLPQLFQFPIPKNEQVIDNEPAPDSRRIGGMPKYKMRAHFQRFVVGPIVTGGYKEGETVVDDRDDTVAYEELQNACLEGRAVLCWEKVNFLKDGAVVIAAKWMTKHDPKEEFDTSDDDEEPDEE
jgi:hypothetical protein